MPFPELHLCFSNGSHCTDSSDDISNLDAPKPPLQLKNQRPCRVGTIGGLDWNGLDYWTHLLNPVRHCKAHAQYKTASTLRCIAWLKPVFSQHWESRPVCTRHNAAYTAMEGDREDEVAQSTATGPSLTPSSLPESHESPPYLCPVKGTPIKLWKSPDARFVILSLVLLFRCWLLVSQARHTVWLARLVACRSV